MTPQAVTFRIPMNRWQYITVLMLGAVSLALSLAAVIFAKANQDLQTELRAQQIEINKGTMSQQLGTNLLRDIATAAVKDSGLKDLLTRNGFTLSEGPAPSPKPTD